MATTSTRSAFGTSYEMQAQSITGVKPMTSSNMNPWAETRDYQWLSDTLGEYLLEQNISQKQINAYVFHKLLSDVSPTLTGSNHTKDQTNDQ